MEALHHRLQWAALVAAQRFLAASALVGADDLEARVDEDVVGPVDADVVDLVLAVAQLDNAVHDAARPCLVDAWIDKVFQAAIKTGAAILAIPITDTLKCVANDRTIEETVSRQRLWQAQTPQVFRRNCCWMHTPSEVISRRPMMLNWSNDLDMPSRSFPARR